MVLPKNAAVCMSALYAHTWAIVRTPQFCDNGTEGVSNYKGEPLLQLGGQGACQMGK